MNRELPELVNYLELVGDRNRDKNIKAAYRF
jgi:hypothetical protein